MTTFSSNGKNYLPLESSAEEPEAIRAVLWAAGGSPAPHAPSLNPGCSAQDKWSFRSSERVPGGTGLFPEDQDYPATELVTIQTNQDGGLILVQLECQNG